MVKFPGRWMIEQGTRGIERLGQTVLARISYWLDELDFLALTLLSGMAGFTIPGLWPFVIRYAGQQIYFTAARRTVMFTLVGLLVGALIALPLVVFGIRDAQLLGRIMNVMIYHQLGPILTALFVVGLSGAAITAELGELRANQAIEHLAAMGIDPYSFFVWPRLVAMLLSLLIVTFWFNLGTTVGAALVLHLCQNIPPAVFFRVCMSGLSYPALGLTGLMVIAYAVHIILVQTFYAFRVRVYVDIPRALPSAFAQSFIGCLVISLGFSVFRYG